MNRVVCIKIFLLLFNFLLVHLLNSQILSLGKMPNNLFAKDCIDKVKVGDNRPSSCTYGDVWYPVINEHFNTNNIGELLNNYSFRYEDADHKDGKYVDNAQTNDSVLIVSKKEIWNHLFGLGISRSVFMNRIPYFERPYFNNATFIHQIDITYLLKFYFLCAGITLNNQTNTPYGKNVRFIDFNIGLSSKWLNRFGLMIIYGNNLFSPSSRQRYANIIIQYKPKQIKHILIGIGFQYKDGEYYYTEMMGGNNGMAVDETAQVFTRSLLINISYTFKY